MKIAPTLHTERLDLRPWSEADLAMLTDLSADPAVIRYIGRRPALDARSARPRSRKRRSRIGSATGLAGGSP